MYPPALSTSAATGSPGAGFAIWAIGAGVADDDAARKNCWIEPTFLWPAESWNAPGRNSTVTTQVAALAGHEVAKPDTVMRYVLARPLTAVGVPKVRPEGGWPARSTSTGVPATNGLAPNVPPLGSVSVNSSEVSESTVALLIGDASEAIGSAVGVEPEDDGQPPGTTAQM